MNSFETICHELEAREPLPPLCPAAAWKPALSETITAADSAELFGDAPPAGQMADACRAGLLVWNDDIETAHGIAQGIENPTGSFWHAIVHRREGDANNSRYWWGLTGEHPAFANIYVAVRAARDQLGEASHNFMDAMESAGKWLPIEFVSACDNAQRNGADDSWLREIQRIEIRELLAWCR